MNCVCIFFFPNFSDRKTERLLMKATCKVVKPDFVTNLKTQHFHFGTVAVDTTATEYITVQNITSIFIKN